MTGRSVSHDTFVVEREYEVPINEVFGAWSEPAKKASWFAGSAEALGAGYELDFRVGGREVNRGGPPDGPIYSYEAEIRDIILDERIVYTYEMSVDGERISVSVATVEFDKRDAMTRLVLTEQGVFLDGLDTVGQHEGGTREFLESLARMLGGVST